VAYIDFGDWFNPISNQYETVEGVWCNCYDCRYDCENAGGRAAAHQHVFYSKSEYRKHKNERLQSYNEYIIRQAELKSIARPKETEAPGEHGRSPGVTTRFNLHTGQLSSDDDRLLGNVRWETLWRASIE
jgi:hypothetical protein